jgi:hypothetical protein
LADVQDAIRGGRATGGTTVNTSAVNTSVGPKGLGGWFVLVMLGLARAVFVYIKTITVDVGLIHTVPQDKVAGVYAEILLTGAMLALVAWVIVEMFMKRRTFPRLWKVMAVATIAYGAIDSVMVSVMFNVPFQKVMDEETIFQYIALIIGIAIWWCYLNASVRVKNTFVN